jgi:hypothetical protein
MPITINGSGTITGVSSLATALVNPIVTTTMGVGNATPAASGAGITFPAALNASSDVNTLDDYEEGTFTPTINFGGGSTGLTYNGTFTSGFYTKVGNIVYVNGSVVLTNKGSSSGQARMGGLPFTANGTPPGFSATWVNITYTGTWTHYVTGAEMYFQEVSEAGGNTEITNVDFSNNSEFRFGFCYRV